MPRAGWIKPVSERRLSDLVSVGVLTRTFPPDLVDEVIAGVGRTEQRNRSLPARVMAYFAIGMALHSEGSYEDVLGLLTDGLSWSSGEAPVKLPSKSAIFQARDRLGFEPVKALFDRVAAPLAEPGTAGASLAGRRLVAIDGTCLDVADSAANADHFGRPGCDEGRAGSVSSGACCCGGGVRYACDLRRGGRAVHDGGEHDGSRRDPRSAWTGDAAAGRSRVLRVSAVESGCSDRRGLCCGGRRR